METNSGDDPVPLSPSSSHPNPVGLPWPQVTREEILNAHIHSVMVIDVDQKSLREIDPSAMGR